MLRFYYLIAINLFGFAGMIMKMRRMTNNEKYSEEDCYKYLQYMISVMQKKSFTHTEVYGAENLPSEGGYAMYSNHQGK